MLKILILAPTPFFSDRGCHVRIYEQANYLHQQGHKVVILTYPLGVDPPGLQVRRVRPLAGYAKLEPGPAWPRLWLDARVLREAIRVCQEFSPTLIHAHLHEGCLIATVLKKRVGRPVVFDYQGSLTGESLQHGFIREGSLLANLFRKVEAWIDRSADRVIVSASALAEPLLAMGIQPETVADGVDLTRFCPGPPDENLFHALHLPSDRPVVVYLGVLSEYQGADILLKSLRLLRQRGTPVHFLVMGYPEQEWKERAERMGIADSITFTGRLDYFRAPDFLRLGRLALAPKISRAESNGKVLNYMACGLPVVAFDLPINRELLAETGELVPCFHSREESSHAFAEAIQRLLANPAHAQKLAETGRKRVDTEFSMDKQGQKLLAVYQELVG